MSEETQTICFDKEKLANNENHFLECHERWMKRRNRKLESSEYKDDWWREQCFACKFYVPLIGAFIDDYGACTNENSSFDKQVMFEHDGCENFVFGLDESGLAQD